MATTQSKPVFIETYKGVEIWNEPSDSNRPVTTKEHGIPVIGTMECGHKSIDAAKEYIDKTRKQP